MLSVNIKFSNEVRRFNDNSLDSPNNEKNPIDSTVPYLSGTLTTPKIHVENDTKKKEPKTLQPKVLVSTNSHLINSLNLQSHSESNKKKWKF